MPGPLLSILWAVHIADGVLAGPWLLGGFLLAGGLGWFGARGVRDEEIPRIALLSAVFFVASSLHVPFWPTSIHLLLNSLVGAVLGWRAALAIPIGLGLQAALIGHGAFSTLGVNSCVLVLPALLAGGLCGPMRRLPWARRPGLRAGVVSLCALAWLVSLAYSGALLLGNGFAAPDGLDLAAANRLLAHPLTWVALLTLAALAAWLERRLDHPPEFALGLLLGELTVVLTLVLNTLVLLWGGLADWHTVALLVFLAHLPVAVIEGMILGFTISFLARVQPELLGMRHDLSEPRTSVSGSSTPLPNGRGPENPRAGTPPPAALPTAPVRR